MTKQANEGEGNRTAAKLFNKHETEFAKSGKVADAAAKAATAVDGPEGAELKKAEKVGLSKTRV